MEFDGGIKDRGKFDDLRGIPNFSTNGLENESRIFYTFHSQFKA